MAKICNVLPPKEIYDVLHEAEAAGVNLPASVEKWWEQETVLNEAQKNKQLTPFEYLENHK